MNSVTPKKRREQRVKRRWMNTGMGHLGNLARDKSLTHPIVTKGGADGQQFLNLHGGDCSATGQPPSRMLTVLKVQARPASESGRVSPTSESIVPEGFKNPTGGSCP